MKQALGRLTELGWVSAARLAQSAERKALNLVVVGSSPTVGVLVLSQASTSKIIFFNYFKKKG